MGILDTEIQNIHVKNELQKSIVCVLMAITRDAEDVLQGYIWIFLLHFLDV